MIQLFEGDMRDVLPGLALVDAVIADAPYHSEATVKRFGKPGSKLSSRTENQNRPSEQFVRQDWDSGGIAFEVDTWRPVLDVLKPGGHLAAFGSSVEGWRMTSAIASAGFEIRDTVPWIYGTGMPRRHGRAMPANEPITIARKPISEKTVKANMAQHGVGELFTRAEQALEGGWPRNVICDDESGHPALFYHVKASARDRRGSKHPTVKPRELIEWLLRLLAPPGGLVLDPFAGSGTTGWAARGLGMRANLIEKDAGHAAHIRRLLWADRVLA